MSKEISWENRLSRAVGLAKESNRLILIDFYGDT